MVAVVTNYGVRSGHMDDLNPDRPTKPSLLDQVSNDEQSSEPAFIQELSERTIPESIPQPPSKNLIPTTLAFGALSALLEGSKALKFLEGSLADHARFVIHTTTGALGAMTTVISQQSTYRSYDELKSPSADLSA